MLEVQCLYDSSSVDCENVYYIFVSLHTVDDKKFCRV